MSDEMNRIDAKVGEVIFSEGEIGSRAYLLEQGQIEICRANENGERVVLGKVDRGGVFGEMALIDDTPRMATATVSQDAVLLEISEQTFKKKMERSDPFIRALLRIFAQNIRSTAKARRQGAQTQGDESAAPSGPMPIPANVSWMLDL